MNFKLLVIPLLLFILISGCKKDKELSPITPEEKDNTIIQTKNIGMPNQNFTDLEIPEGFNYKTSRMVALDLTTADSTQQIKQAVGVKIFGGKVNGQKELFYEGVSKSNGKLQIQLEVPMHFESIIIMTSFDGHFHQNEFPVSDLISKTIIVNGDLSNPPSTSPLANNCYPSVSTTYAPDNQGITIISDQVMSTIEVFYEDGTSEIVQVNGTTFSY